MTKDNNAHTDSSKKRFVIIGDRSLVLQVAITCSSFFLVALCYLGISQYYQKQSTNHSNSAFDSQLLITKTLKASKSLGILLSEITFIKNNIAAYEANPEQVDILSETTINMNKFIDLLTIVKPQADITKFKTSLDVISSNTMQLIKQHLQNEAEINELLKLSLLNFARSSSNLDTILQSTNSPQTINLRKTLHIEANKIAITYQDYLKNPILENKNSLNKYLDNYRQLIEQAKIFLKSSAASRDVLKFTGFVIRDVDLISELVISIDKSAGNISSLEMRTKFLIGSLLKDLDSLEISLKNQNKIYSAKIAENKDIIDRINIISIIAFLILVLLATQNALTQLITPMTTAMKQLVAISKGEPVSSMEVKSNLKEVITLRDIAIAFQKTYEQREQLKILNQNHELEITKQFEKTKLIADSRSRISSLIGEISDQHEDINSVAEEVEINMQNADVYLKDTINRIENTNTDITNIAAIRDQITEGSKVITREVNITTKIVSQAEEEAIKAQNNVQSLDEAAQNVNDIVEMISSIAGQTNLLALNATIEAARAGDAGKGFAVVANEVKGLANQTADATNNISSRIKEIQDLISASVNSIKSISDIIRQANDASGKVAQVIEEQSEVRGAISDSIRAMIDATQSTLQDMNSVGDMSQKAVNSTKNLFHTTAILNQNTQKTNSQIEDFFQEIQKM